MTCGVCCCSQARETLHPEEDAPTALSAENTKDLAEALQQEIDEIKDTSTDVFTYNKTGIGGLIYITMRDDAGDDPPPGPPVILYSTPFHFPF